jgi:hypothetical protein
MTSSSGGLQANISGHESRQKLLERCGFSNPQSRKEQIIDTIIQQTEMRYANNCFRRETAKAMAVLAKTLDWKSIHRIIVSKCLEKFQNWKEQCWDLGNKDVVDSKPQQLLTWVIDCIGNVSRIYPVEGREHLLEIFKPIQNNTYQYC